mgnify:CR=1 FL=1
MFNNWLSAYVSKYTDDIPDYLKMSKDEMLDEAAMDFVNGDISFAELCDECDLIGEMFADEEGYN